MSVFLYLNRVSGFAVLFLVSVLTKILSLPWFYQFLYLLFTVPDYSFTGFISNIGMIILLSFTIIIAGIYKLALIIANKN
ncbi:MULTISPECIES: hypothetical protein [Acidianus]|uniref:Uncharacterized protein n=1 Tax=Candidatus Acidianus copahuensis TaxID=1160895 RepID=A0A031LUS0_9CREN|nr:MULTISPECIES: hypothetical protein [Acidianus]EZQ10898.1 hypothetical protein CM19_03400 [Candidatus Acidianus copahuensis]NON63050.1 hypothetical protein [Acidianus sp. RZ1]